VVIKADLSGERQFIEELLQATRTGRANWTGSIRPGCFQLVAGDYLVAIVADPQAGHSLGLYHSSGHLIEALSADRLSLPEGPDFAPLFEELHELARRQALGLRARWRRFSRVLATAQAGEPA
jgi:hypothetical protein